MSRSTKYFTSILLRVCDVIFKFGVFCVLLGAGLTGWGCSCPCSGSALYGTAVGPCAASPLPPNGTCYARVAYVPLSCCLLGLALVVYFQCWSRAAASQASDDASMLRDPADLPSALDSLGTVATLAAGFVMYNITTFDTDVIRGPLFHQHGNLFGLNRWGYAFLWANWLAFSLGVAVTMCVQIINGNFAWITDEDRRRRYLTAVESRLRPVEILTLSSLVCFVLAFGLLGMAKMSPDRPEGFVASLALLSVLAVQAQKMSKYRKHAERGERGIILDQSLSVAVLQKQLNAITSPSMMFGGFAYNGISFLFRSGAELAPTYVVGMAACFSCALYLTFTSAS
ncbi:ANK1 [Symbiodinium sp. KB8]|nr:ANK1 [Symbiodinium sp. KB8]